MSLDFHHLLTALQQGPRTFTAQQLAADPGLLRCIRRALACGLIIRPASLHPAAYESGQADCNLSRGISIQGLTVKGLQYLQTVPATLEGAGMSEGDAGRRASAGAAVPH